MTFEEARNIIAKDGFARYLVVKSESETPKYPSWPPMPCQSKAFVEAVRYLCLSGYEVLRDSEIDEYDKKHGFMTLDEAKKILKKEGFRMALEKEVVNQTGAIREFEKPEVCEAIKVANANRWTVALSPTEWDEREARLKKEYEENTKAPDSGEEQPKEKVRIICCSATPKADFYYKHVLNESNPALKEAASQFNDALLDEQAKKIAELTKENERLKDQVAILDVCKKHNDNWSRKQIKSLGKEIAKLNGIIHDKNEELKRKTKGCCELVTENVDLEKKLSDKDAVLSDVAEELRLSKIREKNLTEVGQKYMKENEELKKKLADKVVNKINAQALKSAESALAWKDRVIYYKDMAIAYNEKEIADLGKELKAAKKELKEKTKLVETVRKRSKEYREFGVEAVKMIRKMAKVIVNEGTVSSEDFKEYRRLANGGIFMPEISEKELTKLQEKVCADIIADDTFEKWLLFGKIIIKSDK